MNEEELKPCPFCGNPKPYLHQEEYEKTLWIIMCKDCHSEFTVGRKRRLVNGRTYTGELLSNRDDVINAWNRRADFKWSCEEMEKAMGKILETANRAGATTEDSITALKQFHAAIEENKRVFEASMEHIQGENEERRNEEHET